MKLPWRRPVALLLLVLLVLVSLFELKPVHAAERCFGQTGQCISDRFLAYWEQQGGLPVFGFPITPARPEVNPDTGHMYLTQWFERARFELHPENAAPYDVLLGRLGNDRLVGSGIAWEQLPRDDSARPSCLYFIETRFNVCDQEAGQGILTYWRTHGLQDRQLNHYQRSLALFGLPLSPAQVATNAQGDRVLTQWFERARFEWHPTKPQPYRVLLGLLGPEIREPPRPQLQGRIAYIGTLGSQSGDLFVYNAADGSTSFLTNTPADERDPMWSPDGRRIVFVADEGGRDHIYTVNPSGLERTRLTSGDLQFGTPAWSPDGQRIAVAATGRPGTEVPEIYVMAADGTNLQRLTTSRSLIGAIEPTWSPDGTHIAYTALGVGSAGTSDIYVMNADGSNQVPLARGGGFDLNPAWSPDGQWIAYTSDVGDPSQVLVVSADGSRIVRLTYSPYGINAVAWSPDARHLVFNVVPAYGEEDRASLYVMPFDPEGAPAA